MFSFLFSVRVGYDEKYPIRPFTMIVATILSQHIPAVEAYCVGESPMRTLLSIR